MAQKPKPSGGLFPFVVLMASAPLALAQPAQAANSATTLQFGGVNSASTTQVGGTSNTAQTLQFGALNFAATYQSGRRNAINNSTIAQAGLNNPAISNNATVSQRGGSNWSLVGQISGNNAATITQWGHHSNGSYLVQGGP